MEWTGAKYADAPTVEVRRRVGAPADRVWDLVSDIELMAQVSEELQRVEWVDASRGPGSRFRGTNRDPGVGEWTTTCTVVDYDPGRSFSWVVEDVENPTATWRFTLTPDGDATEVTQWVQLGPGPSGLLSAIEAMPDKEEKIVFVRLRQFETGMTRNLEEIARRAEGAATPLDEQG